MNENKVRLPKEVAEAIDDVKQYYGNADIIATIVNDRGCSAYGTKMRVLISYSRDGGNNLDTLMRALVNGYEVEKSPEEKVREYYEEYYIDASNEDNGKYRQVKGEVACVVIETTLDLLGIKINGVNAND